MKKPTTLLFLLCQMASFISAQVVPNYDFRELASPTTCPFDSTTSVSYPENWTIYQTLNNAWDGPVDSSQCINAYLDNNSIVLNLAEINKDRPIFVRSTLDDSTAPLLDKDNLYHVFGNLDNSCVEFLNFGDTCTNGLCTGLFIGVGIPDSTGTGRALRGYSLNPDFDNPWTWTAIEGCIPTEYFSKNLLREVIFKFSFRKGLATDQLLPLRSTFMEPVYDFAPLTQAVVPEFYFDGSSYNVNLSNLTSNGYGSTLLMYQSTDYPSAAYPYYLEAMPETNAHIPSIINLTIREYNTLVTQPFSFLRGALVEGDSTQRHELNIINMGGSICIIIAELVFDGSSHFIYHDGKVELTGSTACMQFINGARLEVAKGAHLDYGHKGEGALALGKNSTILLRENSSIHINNDLVLLEKSEAKEEQVYIELKPGNVLSFGEQAHLWKHAKNNRGQMHLNVLMNGGVLDDRHLSASERKLIRRIYPQPAVALKSNVLIQQNPIEDLLAFQVLATPATPLTLALYNQEGKLIWSKAHTATEGYNAFQVPVAKEASGLYLLQVENGQERYTQKIIKR